MTIAASVLAMTVALNGKGMNSSAAGRTEPQGARATELVGWTASDDGKGVNRTRLTNLIEDLRQEARRESDGSDRESLTLPGVKIVSDGNFEFVAVGGFVARLAMKFAEDEDVKAAAGLVDHLKKLYVVDYEDCSEALKDKFNAKIGKALRGSELLMEAKDDDERMSIYGTPSADGSTVSDIVLFAPQSGALICFFGSMDSDKVGELIASAQDD